MNFKNGGFTLIEVLVSTIVFAMIMVSVLSLVSYGSEVWQRTHFASTLANEGQMIMDTIDREMSFASSVSSPAVGDPATSTIIYKKLFFDYNRGFSASGNFKIEKHATENRIYSQFIEGSFTDGTWTAVDYPDATSKHLARSMHNYDIGRHADTLQISRTTLNRIDVRVILKAKRTADEYETEQVYSRSILIPSHVP